MAATITPRTGSSANSAPAPQVTRAQLQKDWNEADMRFREAEARVADIQRRIAIGELINKKAFEDRAFAFIRGLRDKFLSMASRHAAIFAVQQGRPVEDVAAEIDAWALDVVNYAADKAKARGHLVIERAWRPDPKLSVSEWADKHRVLTTRSSSEAGPYRTSRTPYLREIMDALSVTSNVQRVVFKKGAQLGVTECGNCWVGYIIDHAPGPILCVQPTTELAKRFSQQRIAPMIEESPKLKERVLPAREKESGNTTLMKEFTGGIMCITGANSAVGLRSMPVRFLFVDECDAFPPDVGGEGDAISLAEARTRTFSYRSKVFLVSTPRIKGTSIISREYERTDQRKYFVPCPHCGHKQVLVFDNLRYGKTEGKGKIDCGEVTYECAGCKQPISEAHKTEMLERGGWQATAESNDRHVRGYHLSALYSPAGWLDWHTIAEMWENEAAKSADARKTFTNTVLGEDWEEEASAVPDWQRIYERRETWPHRMVPLRGLFLTSGVDVQGDRLECDVWAWGRGLESWLVEHIDLYGDPSRPDVWNALTQLLSRTWDHEGGSRLSLSRIAVDTGAFTNDVYTWCRTQDRALVMPVKGVPQYDRTVPVSGPTRIDVLPNGTKLKGGINLFTVSASFFKREWYRNLELAKPTDEELAAGASYPPGYAHISTAASDQWTQQAVAEQPVIVRSRHGFAIRTEWRQLRHRNEALDMRCYARAAAWLMGADRFSENTWRHYEAQLGVPSPTPSGPSTPQSPQPAPNVPRQVPPRGVPRPGHNRVGYSRW